MANLINKCKYLVVRKLVHNKTYQVQIKSVKQINKRGSRILNQWEDQRLKKQMITIIKLMFQINNKIKHQILSWAKETTLDKLLHLFKIIPDKVKEKSKLVRSMLKNYNLLLKHKIQLSHRQRQLWLEVPLIKFKLPYKTSQSLRLLWDQTKLEIFKAIDHKVPIKTKRNLTTQMFKTVQCLKIRTIMGL